MFYVPFNGNDTELSRLLECVEQYKPDILNKRVPLHVDGYCTAGESDADNLAMAKVRSNRVKSELIVRGGIKEECFVTKNHSRRASKDRGVRAAAAGAGACGPGTGGARTRRSGTPCIGTGQGRQPRKGAGRSRKRDGDREPVGGESRRC